MPKIIYEELSKKIIGCAITVHKIVGPGFLENVYEQSLCVELKLNNIPFTRQKMFSVFYKGYVVGKYLSDVVIDNKIIVELKSVPCIKRNMVAALVHPCTRGIHPSMDISTVFKLSSCFKYSCWLHYQFS
jgi:GxxExxY protein